VFGGHVWVSTGWWAGLGPQLCGESVFPFDRPLRVEEHLSAEAARVKAELERLQAELLLINEHLRLKQSERETHHSQGTTLMAQAEMLRSALEPLEAERAKVRLLVQNFDHE
jgi:hypothetical protein